MKTRQYANQLRVGMSSLRGRTLVAAIAAFAMTNLASGAQIGMNFVRGPNTDGPNTQNGYPNALLPDALAGVAPYTQTNWNNLGFRGTNIVLL
ncbi:MAG TPA: hypothetical protein VK475_10255, partial [Pyrinomonadaceae bacterium]|nr:hypothetical protein [Pyrinomonadaceae bacterium]